MYISLEYLSFNCKRKSVFIDVYFYTIPERMCTGQSCSLRRVIVNLFVHYSRETMYISLEYLSFNRKRKSVFIDVYFYTIPERM